MRRRPGQAIRRRRRLWLGRRTWCVLACIVLACALATRAQDGPAAAKPQPAAAKRGASAAASPASIRPTQRVRQCFSDGCHANYRDFKFLHGPVAVGACQMCHSYVDPKKHTFELKRKGEKLCEFCHIGRAEGEVVHEPVKQGQCLACHDPHGGPNRELLLKGGLGELCNSCHDDVMRGRKNAHGPVGTGSCAVCHRSHASEHPKLLVAEGRQLCLDCHKQMDQRISQVQYVHEPVKGDCLQCHEAHASNHTMQLKDSPARLCVSCHEHQNIQKLVTDAVYKHSPVTEGQACMNCHTPHGADLASLMQSPPSESCLTCHDKPIQIAAAGRTVAGVADLAKPGLSRHGPIRDGGCNGCHDSHGGKVSRLLTGDYSELFYEPFETRKYSLCFNCHTEKLALVEETRTVTRFRNGSKNLHFLHVNKPERGRSCRACHSTHVSPNPMHVRQTVPFGKWDMPVNFVPSKTGGSCTAGCHQTLAYDREKAVEPPTTQPAKIAAPSLTKRDKP